MAEKRIAQGPITDGSPETAGAAARNAVPASAHTPPRQTPEARRSLRRRIPMHVVINYGMSYSEAQPVRDLSMNGVFVDMAASELYEGRFVEVVLRYPYKGRRVEHRLPARVRRVSPEGVALRFGPYDDDTYTDLVNLLYAQ